MSVTDCFYALEDHPDVFNKIKNYLRTQDESGLPTYVTKVLADAQTQKRMAQLNAIKVQDAMNYIAEHVGSTSAPSSWARRLVGMSPKQVHERALENLIAGHYHIGKNRAGRLSLEGRGDAVRREYHAKLADAMAKYRPRNLGLNRSMAAQEELVKAFYGASTDVDAKAYSQIFSRVFDEIVDRYNAAGGNITKLDVYRLPQFSDSIKVGRTSFDEWYNDILPLLADSEKITQARSRLGLADDVPIDDKALRMAFRKAYDSIRTRGTIDVEPGRLASSFRSPVAGRHQQHRFFHFRDADAWIKYHRKYGEGTPYASITGHVDRMSREIAAIETLGPNAERNLEFLVDMVKKTTGIPTAGSFARKMYKEVMGELEGAGDPVLASRMRDIRNVLTGTKLWGAGISALSDSFFMGSTARLNGVSAVKTYVRFLKMLNPANEADRIFAGKLGLSMDYALDRAHHHNRISAITGDNRTAQYADFGMRVNGLTHWTHSAEQAFGWELLSRLTELSDTSYTALPRAMRQALDRYGIDGRDWGNLASTPRLKHKGVEYITAAQISDIDTRARIMGMIAEETRYAVPSPNARVRTMMNQGLSAGTVGGELFRSLGQFKAFPTTILVSQVGRRLTYDSGWSRVASLGSMIIGTTIIGSLAWNIKELAKGRTPIDWRTGSFWAHGFIQGGGAGLIGDVLFLDPRKRGSAIEFMAGPLVGELNRVLIDFMITPTRDMFKLEQDVLMKMANNATAMGREFIPAPLNLPFLRLAIQRSIFDQIHRLTDPEFERKQRRLRRYLARERGQDYWWEP